MSFNRQWAVSTEEALDEVLIARDVLKETELSEDALQLGLNLVKELEIDSSRAEITMFEAARAYAAIEGRTMSTVDDVRTVAPLALRQRRSDFMTNFFENQRVEDEQIFSKIVEIMEGK